MNEKITVDIEKLLNIMAMLRDERHGCSWDLKQDFNSITSHTLEEVYEVIDSIENKDYLHLANELGDLLFQVVFYAQMGKEAGYFDFNDVINEICEKLLTRHPHVFPDATIESFGQKTTLTPEQVEKNWEEIKKQERLNNTESGVKASALDNVPQAFPALMRAKKLQKKAASVGFDWSDMKDVIAKLKEEIAEFEEALEENDEEHVKEEFGDVLFSVVNISRHIKQDSESCLRAANNKFEDRFRIMEEIIEAAEESVSNLELEELEKYWIKAKNKQNNNKVD